jgi:hypothetical protein
LLAWSYWHVYQYQDITDIQINIKANEYDIEYNLIQQKASAKSRMNKYSENAIYIYIYIYIFKN